MMVPLLRIRSFLLALLLMSASAVVAQQTSGAVRDIQNIEVKERQLQEAVASRTLTWLTGSSSNNDYISVGRTANYFGFVALRVASGQSLSRSNVAKDTLAVLTQSQRDALSGLLKDQVQPFEKTQQARFRINRALEGLLIGEKISRDAFLALGRDYGASEAELGRVIAQRLGEVAQTLTLDQKEALVEVRTAHISGQGHTIERTNLKLKLSKEDKKEFVNLAARFLSWTTGSPEFNDFEVVGKPSQHFGFVSLRIDSKHGVRRGDVAKEVLELLSSDQQHLLATAAAHDAKAFVDFLQARGELMRHLESSLGGGAIDVQKVEQAGATVGEIEAGMTWSQAMAMIGVRDSLTPTQSSGLLAMRAKYTADTDSLPENPVDRGRQLFAQCVLCHESASRTVAPDLSGIVGRGIAGDAAFKDYSSALRSFSDTENVWSEKLLGQFLASPRRLVPGTIMGFDGLDNARDIEALVEYLKSR